MIAQLPIIARQFGIAARIVLWAAFFAWVAGCNPMPEHTHHEIHAELAIYAEIIDRQGGELELLYQRMNAMESLPITCSVSIDDGKTWVRASMANPAPYGINCWEAFRNQ